MGPIHLVWKTLDMSAITRPVGRELFVLYPTLGPVHTGLVESNDCIKILVPGSWYQDLGTRILVPGSWYQDLGTKILVPGSWYQDLGTKILVPRFTMGSQVHDGFSEEVKAARSAALNF